MEKKVLILQQVSSPGIEKMLADGWQVQQFSGDVDNLKKEDLMGYDAVVVRTAKIRGELLRELPDLKVISRYGVGFDNVDVETASELGIWVTNVPAANIISVAEGTISMLLQLGRHFGQLERDFRAGGWKLRNDLLGSELAGKTLGAIGIGRIGREVCRKAVNGLDMKVLGYDPYLPEDAFPEGVQCERSWERLFAESDFITVHMPFNGTVLVGEREFSMMKKTAYFINVSRGGLIDEAALIHALQNGTIAGAGLDVFTEEPPAADNPLLHMENTVVLPHVAGLSVESFARSGLQNAESIEAVISGKEPPCAVNRPQNPRNFAK